MENVVLTIHLILALCLIGVVLLQRSEGGGLGMGGGGGGGVMSGRAAATALTKLTWIFAVCFIVTSVTLTLLAAQKSSGASVIDQFGGTAPKAPVQEAPLGKDLLPPTPSDAPLTPPRADQPATPDATPAAPGTPAPAATPETAPAAPAPAGSTGTAPSN
ncbi:preprotein translocase subunit SecG [Pseudorhodobacter sp.]|uniref:preprotein translocase subunit SecG n=1 Tax=Pseudorhodobacter sp. TaxID=1934400 RepID=UPI0026498CC6|nr:preprotein translocase subunit SecG [Pseudorhodobacter sp.]MDN5788242.1 preprotein translocase subunit SecG [Pseudorhodobacter sp.]